MVLKGKQRLKRSELLQLHPTQSLPVHEEGSSPIFPNKLNKFWFCGESKIPECEKHLFPFNLLI